VFDRQLAHGKVLRITRCEPTADRKSRRSDEAIRLRERAAAPGVLPTPLTSPPTLDNTEGDDP
jgi:hypothetical protein